MDRGRAQNKANLWPTARKTPSLEQKAPYFVLRGYLLRGFRTKTLDFVLREYFLRGLRTKQAIFVLRGYFLKDLRTKQAVFVLRKGRREEREAWKREWKG